MGAMGEPYSDAALTAAWATKELTTEGILDAAHDREALGLDASVHAASYRREVLEEVAAWLRNPKGLAFHMLANGDDFADLLLRGVRGHGGEAVSDRLDSLSEGLRNAATYLPPIDDSIETARHLMRLAADRLEGYEAAERERLEHEAVIPEGADLPLIPMPPLRHTFEPCAFAEARERYQVAMTEWVRAVTATERTET